MSPRLEFPMASTEDSTHLLIYTASETVEHRIPRIFEFFDAAASVSGEIPWDHWVGRCLTGPIHRERTSIQQKWTTKNLATWDLR